MNYKKYLTLLLTAFFLCTNNANSATTNWQENESKASRTRLVASFYQDDSGQRKLIAGLYFKISQGWKIYGNGSDGIGLPPSLDFTGSQNYLKHRIIWPQAINEEETIGTEVLKYTVYHDEVILPIEIDLKENGKPTELTLKINYGLCKDICIPASESFSIKISEENDEEALALIQKFYPKKISNDDATNDNATNDIVQKTENQSNYSMLISGIVLAIIGGAILNIMPCVLPVLSIKLLSVINHSGAKISHIRLAFFATICGIILCFLAFAGIAAAIKITGNSLGWGLQFQNPYFLIFLIVVLVFLSGNLLGIFEISFDQFVATFLNKKISEEEAEKNIFIPNFLSGILAVLLATPCSAPFLGSAISFALSQNITTIFAIFFAIGFGFSSPYIALIIAPKLVYLLPKPGNWMLKIKKLMAVFLGATVIWLVYVLSDNIGLIQSLIATALSILLLLCLEIKSKFIKFFLFITLVTTLFYLPVSLQKKSNHGTISENNLWVEFDEEALHQLVEQGNIVVVDVTADWCLTCKLNKTRVLNDKDVIKKLKSPNIIAMRADITKPNEEVMNFLRQHNRFAIPFNAVFGPNAKNGILASEFLKKKEFLDLIDKAGN